MTVPPASQLTSDRDAADVETTISVSGNEAAGSSAAGMRATADDSSDKEHDGAGSLGETVQSSATSKTSEQEEKKRSKITPPKAKKRGWFS